MTFESPARNLNKTKTTEESSQVETRRQQGKSRRDKQRHASKSEQVES